jgi:hypothetical protein
MGTERDEEVRDRAEAQFKKKAKAAREGDAARTAYAAVSGAVDEKTARLKSLRLAKEASDAQANQQTVTPKRKARQPPERRVSAHRV